MRRGFDLGDKEALAFLSAILNLQMSRAVETVASFLGSDADASGGTMGSPKSCPPWMYTVEDRLYHHFMKVMRCYFEAPYSERELDKRALSIICWGIVQYIQ